MDNEIAQALLKLAEVHDRRLGEIGTALARLADQLTHTWDVEKTTGISSIGFELGQIANAIDRIEEKMPQPESDSDDG